MAEHSAGIVLYRARQSGLEVLLLHMGGPFWAKKEAGAWSIPKGVVNLGEDALSAARREFAEETGAAAPAGDLLQLGDFRYASGKVVTAFAAAGEFDPSALRSNLFTLEWPPRSGRMAEFPETDRAQWFTLAEAEEKLVAGQRPILGALAAALP